MAFSQKLLLIPAGALAVGLYSWAPWKSPSHPKDASAIAQATPARPPGGASRDDRILASRESAAASRRTNAGAMADPAAEVMSLRPPGVPSTVGKSGLWVGTMPSDVATCGRSAFGTARAGDSRADLMPNQSGMFQRLYCATGERIEFQVRYPGLKTDQWVDIGILDGGELETAARLKPDAAGRVSFVFKTGPTDGSYRISLNTSDHDMKMLEVWAGAPEWDLPVTSR